MKKILTVFGVMLLTLLVLTITSNAFTYSLRLEPQTTTVKPGDTVNVAIKLSELSLGESEDGIIGFEATLDYDSNIFSRVTAVGNDNWSGTTTYAANSKRISGFILSQADEIKETGDIATFTLTVAEGASEGTTNITLKNIKLSNGSSSSVTTNDVTTTVTVSSNAPVVSGAELSNITVTKVPAKTSYKAGERVDLTGMEITATYSDGTTKKVTDFTYTPAGALTENDKQITITYVENGVTKTITQAITVASATSGEDTNKDGDKNNNNVQANNVANNNTDNSTANKVLSSTGLETVSGIIVAALVVTAGISYMSYKRYKNI